MPRQITVFMLLATIVLMMGLSGCGETIRGIGRDAARVGRGVKTVFVSD